MAADEHKITIRPNGPYLLRGGIPLVRKSQVMSEHGEPLTWKKDGAVETDETGADSPRANPSATRPPGKFSPRRATGN